MRLEVALSSRDLAFLVRVLEGVGHLAVVETVNGKAGRARLIFDESRAEEVEDFLTRFPKPITVKPL